MEEKINRILEILDDISEEDKIFILYRVISKLIENNREKIVPLFKNLVFLILSEYLEPIYALDILGRIANDILDQNPTLKRIILPEHRDYYTT